MLFRSLIDRFLGTNEAPVDAFEVTSRTTLFYDRYPGLMDLLLRLLQDSVSSNHTTKNLPSKSMGNGNTTREALFPILDLLRRARPDKPERSKLRRSVLDATGSSERHVRDMAARTYVTLYQDYELAENLSTLFPFTNLTHNAFHGRLICLKGLVRNHISTSAKGQSSAVRDWLDSETVSASNLGMDERRYLESIIIRVFSNTRCFAVRAAYTDVLNEIGKSLLKIKGKFEKILKA